VQPNERHNQISHRSELKKAIDAMASKLRAHCGTILERLVRLFAQHGFSDGLKTVEGLSKELIDGVIFSPRDITPEKLRESANKFAESAPISERLFDPQYYATVNAFDPLSRTGYLKEEYCCYFRPRRYEQLLCESQVIEDVSKVLECEAALPLTALIGPNIIISRSFDSAEAAIAMNFVRATGVQGKKIAPEKRIYATLAVSGEALINTEELLGFLNQLIVLETPPDGFYILVSGGTTEAELFNAEVIAGWMFLNHKLSVKGFSVINGFSDLLTPFLGAAGAEAGATGWWSNLRTFSLERFSPTIGGGRTPTERYLSCALLNRITYYELDILRRRVRSVLNRLGTDVLYAWDGSQPPRNKEVLQSWDAIKALNQALVSPREEESLHRCGKAVKTALDTYALIRQQAVALNSKSGDSHLEDLDGALRLFKRLAELDFV
jgi:hypothetical protein